MRLCVQINVFFLFFSSVFLHVYVQNKQVKFICLLSSLQTWLGFIFVTLGHQIIVDICQLREILEREIIEWVIFRDTSFELRRSAGYINPLVVMIAQATTTATQAVTFTRIFILIGWKTSLTRIVPRVATLEVTCVKSIF